jgi:hypothetical protein
VIMFRVLMLGMMLVISVMTDDGGKYEILLSNSETISGHFCGFDF